MSTANYRRYYVKHAGEGTNSFNIYDRAQACAGNSTGHACVVPLLGEDEAHARCARMNARVDTKPSAVSDEARRGYVTNGRAWYAKVNEPADAYERINVGRFYSGCDYEFSITWPLVGGKHCPRVHLFSDGWAAFEDCRDLFERLHDLRDTDPTPTIIEGALDDCGFEDMTPTEKGEAE